MDRAYRQSTKVLGLVLIVLGVATVVSTLVRGGGPAAVGVFLGVGLTAFGAARIYLSRASEPRGGA